MKFSFHPEAEAEFQEAIDYYEIHRPPEIQTVNPLFSPDVETVLDALAVTVNGEAREVAPGLTVLGFVESLGRHPRTVAVEYNGSILPRADYEHTILATGDRLEIVHFVQGG